MVSVLVRSSANQMWINQAMLSKSLDASHFITSSAFIVAGIEFCEFHEFSEKFQNSILAKL